MKINTKLWLFILSVVLMGTFSNPSRVSAQARVNISFQTFYNELSPYGRWINYPNYGRAWIPSVEAGFQPYGTRGQWIVTEYGNTWASDYEWGWAPFHYGRWTFDDYYGWIWIPGNEWGPAWVSWRSADDYYGWAPLAPGGNINVNINIPVSRWIFVPRRYITSRSVYNYCIPRNRTVNIYHNTTIINNVYVNDNRRYVSGPGRAELERATRSRVSVYRVDDSDRPSRSVAQNGSFKVYRPGFAGTDSRRGDNNNNSSRPERITDNQRRSDQWNSSQRDVSRGNNNNDNRNRRSDMSPGRESNPAYNQGDFNHSDRNRGVQNNAGQGERPQAEPARQSADPGNAPVRAERGRPSGEEQVRTSNGNNQQRNSPGSSGRSGESSSGRSSSKSGRPSRG